MNLKQALRKAWTARALCEGMRRSLEKQEARVRKMTTEICDVVRPVCVRAITAYNTSRPTFLINEKYVELSFRADATVHLGVRLFTSNGNDEPDEWFDDKDKTKIESVFGKILDQMFKESKLPISFGGITVPSSYYPK